MRSIGARLTFWYALCATASLAVLFAIGYQLLETRLYRGLDQLNGVEFRQIQAHLGSGYRAFDSRVIDERIRETSEYASALFYIVIENPGTGIHFYSKNLRGQEIPDLKGQRMYNAIIPGVGEARVDEFLLPPFDVTIATPTRALRESMRAYVGVGAALLALMLLVSIGIGFALSRVVLQPLRLISETADRIRSDNLSERIPASDVRDEISDLARLLNQMFDRLELAFGQIRRFSDEASHELKTPLSLIRLHAEKMLGDETLSPAHAEALVVQMEALARLNRIIDELLLLSRVEARGVAFDLKAQDPEPFLAAFQQDAVALAEFQGARFDLRHAGAGVVGFEEKWIRQVLLNLVANALHVSPAGGVVTLTSTLSEGGWHVAVEDEGPGLTAAQLDRVFDRFVRFSHPGDADGEGDRGSGLGLSICRSIVERHGGHIQASRRAGRGGLRVGFDIPAA